MPPHSRRPSLQILYPPVETPPIMAFGSAPTRCTLSYMYMFHHYGPSVCNRCYYKMDVYVGGRCAERDV